MSTYRYEVGRVLAELMDAGGRDRKFCNDMKFNRYRLPQSAGMVSLHDRALNAINEGWTSPASTSSFTAWI